MKRRNPCWGCPRIARQISSAVGVEIDKDVVTSCVWIVSGENAEGRSDIFENLVFPSDAGTPIERNNFTQRVFKPLLTRAGLRKIRFHDLRHTLGSPRTGRSATMWTAACREAAGRRERLIQSGASLAYIRDQMGHSSIQITVDVYGRLIPGANISVMDRLDDLTSPRQSAMPPQCQAEWEFAEIREVLKNEWLGGRDSNPDTQIQSLQSYR
jgi:hypothetical protein